MGKTQLQVWTASSIEGCGRNALAGKHSGDGTSEEHTGPDDEGDLISHDLESGTIYSYGVCDCQPTMSTLQQLLRVNRSYLL